MGAIISAGRTDEDSNISARRTDTNSIISAPALIKILVKHHNKWYLQTELNSPYCIPLDMLSLQIVFFL